MSQLHRPPSPPWASQPSKQWSLIEIKNGVEVAEHNLTVKAKHCNSKMTLLGRAEDLVDISLFHDSISRFHARIAFDRENQTPWLRDLSSTHGVSVNKQRLPSNTIGREETMSTKLGTRGVVLYPDDIIQLGASTRIFLVVGPTEYSRSASTVPKLIQQQIKENTDAQENDRADNDDLSVSSSDEFYLSDDKIPDEFRPDWERIKALKYKMENIETESERIRTKGDVDLLSSGQVNQLERNNERIESLKTQIHAKESELYQKISPKISNHHRTSENGLVDDDEIDSYFDRTASSNRAYMELSSDGETEETLIVKWNDLQNKVVSVTNKLRKIDEHESHLHKKIQDSKDVDDNFFVQNELSLVRDTQKTLQDEEKLLLKHLIEIEEMIHVVNPKRKKMIDGTFSTQQIARTNNDPRDVDQHNTKVIASNFVIQYSRAAESSLQQSSTRLKPSSNIPDKSTADALMAPPSKRHCAINVSVGIHTIKALTTANVSPVPQNQLQNFKETNMPLTVNNMGEAASVDLGHHDTWKVPNDQDGSGITKLNAKFAGRY
jgi:pSer/pThr/pTyr-binding forkhead associated (FHA) protein